MKQLKLFAVIPPVTISNISAVLMFVGLSLFPLASHAADLIDQSSNVFKFQQKLASNGNVHAQYKLASMYEAGEGINQDIEQAKNWYERAAAAGSDSARQRATYLDVKQRGFDTGKDGAWLESVIADNREHKPEATLLLGQMYSEGIGVKKDLAAALKLLQEVMILGTADVEEQMIAIENEMAAVKKANLAARQARERDKALLMEEKEVALMPQDQTSQSAALEKEAAQRVKAEKRRRYEEVMRKIKLEQDQIDAQQAWATGGSLATADDEI
ncbi:MAG: sel1 repeat family protein [Proteobacteria bacterium]|nr:sel1 repeat family protein [Pseudomonadota bacterium]